MFGFFEAVYSFLIRMVGLRTDAADAAGSAHAKLGYVANKVNGIGTSSDTRASNTVMGWLNTPIKSVQRGTTSFISNYATATATIAAVATDKASVRHLGQQTDSTSTAVALATVVLTDSTTLTFERTTTGGVTNVSWEVVEFY